MKVGDRIHLNGYPNIRGTIIENIGHDNFFGDDLLKVKWNNGSIHNHHGKTLCQCSDRHCEGALADMLEREVKNVN